MPKDLRKYTQQTYKRLIIGGILIVFTVGGLLIYMLYGGGAAVSGILCISIGLLPILAILLFLWLIDWIVKRANRD
jgi:hypothetical protein